MPERPMWDKEVALELGPGPFGVQLDRGPNKRGVVIAGFEPVDGAMGPAEAHGGVEKGMLLVKVDTKDVSTMRRSKIAKLLKETQNRKRTLIFGRLTVGSPEAVVKLPSIASAPNDGAGAKPKASESLKNGKNDKSSKAPDPGNKRELNAASLMKGVAMDVVAHNLADDLAKTLSKKERKALKKAKKAKKNKKSKKMKKSTGKSLEALDVSILDDLDAMVDEEAKEESEAATVPSSRNQRDRGPIDPMTDKRAKKNGFHGNEGGGRRGPERMQSSVSIVEEVAEEEGDDEGADERLPRELEEVEEDIPDEIDETQAAALAHTALSRTDTGADYEDFEDEFEDSDEPDATAAGGGQDDWASMAMGGNARESVSELMEAAADRAIASAQPQRVDAYGNEASTETVHPLYTADVVDDEDENEDDFEGGGAEAGMEQTVFDSLPFCATSPDTLGLVLGLVRSGGVDIAARDGEGNTILQGRRGILARSPSLLFVLGTRSFNMSCSAQRATKSLYRPFVYFLSFFRGTQAAVAVGCVDVVEVLLLECGATAYDCNNSGATPLHFATTARMAALLLDHGADVHAVESEAGCSALHYAAQYEDAGVLELLVQRGAVASLEEYYGYTPADYARTVEMHANAERLEALAAGLAAGGDGFDALIEAVARRRRWSADSLTRVREKLRAIGVDDVGKLDTAMPCLNDLLEMKGFSVFGDRTLEILKQEVANAVANRYMAAAEADGSASLSATRAGHAGGGEPGAGTWTTRVDEATGASYEVNDVTGESRWKTLKAVGSVQSMLGWWQQGGDGGAGTQLAGPTGAGTQLAAGEGHRWDESRCYGAAGGAHSGGGPSADGLDPVQSGHAIDWGAAQVVTDATLVARMAPGQAAQLVEKGLRDEAVPPELLAPRAGPGSRDPAEGSDVFPDAARASYALPLEQSVSAPIQAGARPRRRLESDLIRMQAEAVAHGVSMAARRLKLALVEAAARADLTRLEGREQERAAQRLALEKTQSFRAAQGQEAAAAAGALSKLQAALDVSERARRAAESQLAEERETRRRAAAAAAEAARDASLQDGAGDGAGGAPPAAELAEARAELQALRATLERLREEARGERDRLLSGVSEAQARGAEAEAKLRVETVRADELDAVVGERDREILALQQQAKLAAAQLSAKMQDMQQAAERRAAEQVRKLTAEAQRKVMRAEADMKALTARFIKEQATRRRLYNELEDIKGKIRVFCRMRPLAAYEVEKGCDAAVKIVDAYSLKLKQRKEWKTYEFDRVFAPKDEQEAVFADTKRLCRSAADGFNVCIFAYGQTGSGKTWTMMGKETEGGELLGVAPRAAREIFSIVESNRDKFEYTVSCSLYEIYRDELVDLLATQKEKKALKAKARTGSGGKLETHLDEDGRVVVEGGKIVRVASAKDLLELTAKGIKTRHTGSTLMNAESSRSHMVQMIFIEGNNLATGHTRMGKLTLVDLAGSERADKTGATGDTMKEAQAINKSLSCLGNVISALTTNSKHIPYRDSLLTQLMRDCLGGNAKTLMFVNISPADYNASETFSSLNFAQRCKKVKNKAAASVESAAVKKLKKQLQQLKKEQLKGGGPAVPDTPKGPKRPGAVGTKPKRPAGKKKKKN